jgi:hypothetical protein
MINGTKLLNVAGMTRGRRDGILKSEKVRHVVKIGPMHLKGVWYVLPQFRLRQSIATFAETALGSPTSEPWTSPTRRRSPSCSTPCSSTTLAPCSITPRTRAARRKSWPRPSAGSRSRDSRCALRQLASLRSSTRLTWLCQGLRTLCPPTTWAVPLLTAPRPSLRRPPAPRA